MVIKLMQLNTNRIGNTDNSLSKSIIDKYTKFSEAFYDDVNMEFLKPYDDRDESVQNNTENIWNLLLQSLYYKINNTTNIQQNSNYLDILENRISMMINRIANSINTREYNEIIKVRDVILSVSNETELQKIYQELKEKNKIVENNGVVEIINNLRRKSLGEEILKSGKEDVENIYQYLIDEKLIVHEEKEENGDRQEHLSEIIKRADAKTLEKLTEKIMEIHESGEEEILEEVRGRRSSEGKTEVRNIIKTEASKDIRTVQIMKKFSENVLDRMTTVTLERQGVVENVESLRRETIGGEILKSRKEDVENIYQYLIDEKLIVHEEKEENGDRQEHLSEMIKRADAKTLEKLTEKIMEIHESGEEEILEEVRERRASGEKPEASKDIRTVQIMKRFSENVLDRMTTVTMERQGVVENVESLRRETIGEEILKSGKEDAENIYQYLIDEKLIVHEEKEENGDRQEHLSEMIKRADAKTLEKLTEKIMEIYESGEEEILEEVRGRRSSEGKTEVKNIIKTEKTENNIYPTLKNAEIDAESEKTKKTEKEEASRDIRTVQIMKRFSENVLDRMTTVTLERQGVVENAESLRRETIGEEILKSGKEDVENIYQYLIDEKLIVHEEKEENGDRQEHLSEMIKRADAKTLEKLTEKIMEIYESGEEEILEEVRGRRSSEGKTEVRNIIKTEKTENNIYPTLKIKDTGDLVENPGKTEKTEASRDIRTVQIMKRFSENVLDRMTTVTMERQGVVENVESLRRETIGEEILKSGKEDVENIYQYLIDEKLIVHEEKEENRDRQEHLSEMIKRADAKTLEKLTEKIMEIYESGEEEILEEVRGRRSSEGKTEVRNIIKTEKTENNIYPTLKNAGIDAESEKNKKTEKEEASRDIRTVQIMKRFSENVLDRMTTVTMERQGVVENVESLRRETIGEEILKSGKEDVENIYQYLIDEKLIVHEEKEENGDRQEHLSEMIKRADAKTLEKLTEKIMEIYKSGEEEILEEVRGRRSSEGKTEVRNIIKTEKTENNIYPTLKNAGIDAESEKNKKTEKEEASRDIRTVQIMKRFSENVLDRMTTVTLERQGVVENAESLRRETIGEEILKSGKEDADNIYQYLLDEKLIVHEKKAENEDKRQYLSEAIKRAGDKTIARIVEKLIYIRENNKKEKNENEKSNIIIDKTEKNEFFEKNINNDNRISINKIGNSIVNITNGNRFSGVINKNFEVTYKSLVNKNDITDLMSKRLSIINYLIMKDDMTNEYAREMVFERLVGNELLQRDVIYNNNFRDVNVVTNLINTMDNERVDRIFTTILNNDSEFRSMYERISNTITKEIEREISLEKISYMENDISKEYVRGIDAAFESELKHRNQKDDIKVKEDIEKNIESNVVKIVNMQQKVVEKENHDTKEIVDKQIKRINLLTKKIDEQEEQIKKLFLKVSGNTINYDDVRQNVMGHMQREIQLEKLRRGFE